ncbi:growth arrest-specific protein 1 [Fukomys damarensis]|uniref:growth arrest-specific protein 1 n=1 Tax=Fukomys damarensis TaxID=885580 RepID=UPI00053F9D78|nr:growth arrest-specific protein 1 [Fukomys damarensis]
MKYCSQETDPAHEVSVPLHRAKSRAFRGHGRGRSGGRARVCTSACESLSASAARPRAAFPPSSACPSPEVSTLSPGEPPQPASSNGRRCDRDSRCNLALGRYLTYCGKLFNGLRCTDECRAVIEDMLAMPKAALLNDCVCDGLERPICESVKENMARLCFGAELGTGPGSSGSDGGLDDYYDEEYDDEQPRSGVLLLLRPLF